MPADIKEVALVALAALAAACSSAPATTASRTDERALGTAAASGGAAAPGGVVDSSLVKAGYSVMRRGGQVLYCRNEVITGQRIGTRICLSAGQIQDEKQNAAKAKDLLNQPSYRCVGSSCNN